ncbi:MAG: hypothetical protein TR69_WS6001000282 [candidate division WS6 bacterium OLB20]|uniref:DUF1653 domain-containing protein n=1 Tax=candidate division WS6 bacterium OLB20 TaxID=1617426 RepID=A0A136M0K6_9BACT|nr:MAG: hypothetical protein TR69_WS6001000282 [candidate division WS6 bacterium OLB20]
MDITPGIYRHYKNKLYRVHFVALHSETQEQLVVYESLYDNETSRFWVRPLKMFTESVVVDGIETKRFTKIEPDEDL